MTAAGSGAGEPTPPDGPQFAETRWYVVELLGERVGYASESEQDSRFDERPARRLRNETWMRLERSNGGRIETLESRARIDWFETPAGEPLGLETEIDQAGSVVRTSGRLHDGTLELVIRTSEGERRERVRWEAGLLAPSAVDARVRELLAAPAGTAIELRSFSPESGNAILTSRVRVVGPAPLPDGSEGVQVEHEMVGTGLVGRELRRRSGELVVQELGPMRMRLASREEALAPIAAGLAPFRGLTVRLGNPPPAPRRLLWTRYRLVLRAAEAGAVSPLRLDEVFRVDGRQTVADGVLVVDAARRDTVPPTPRHLAASSLLESDDPAIVAAAERALAAAGNPKTPVARARALEAWVHEHVRFSGSGVGLATAKQTLSSGDGDCTEHAALLAALLRAAAIPSRMVVGLVAVDHRGDLLPHAWVEAWVDGGWLPLDAAVYSGTALDATHLAMAVSDGADIGSLLELAAPLARGLGRFDLERVE